MDVHTTFSKVRQGGLMLKECVNCGKKFEASSRKKTCSEECLKAYNRVRKNNTQRIRRGDKNHKICVVCGKEFISEYGKKTCSDECSKIRISEQKKQHDAKRREGQQPTTLKG